MLLANHMLLLTPTGLWMVCTVPRLSSLRKDFLTATIVGIHYKKPFLNRRIMNAYGRYLLIPKVASTILELESCIQKHKSL